MLRSIFFYNYMVCSRSGADARAGASMLENACKERCGTSSEESHTIRCGSAFQCPSNALVNINILSFVHLASKPALLIVNIVYLASLGLHAFTGGDGQSLDIIGTAPAQRQMSKQLVHHFLPTLCITLNPEIVTLIIFSLLAFGNGCTAGIKVASMELLEYWRFGDLS